MKLLIGKSDDSEIVLAEQSNGTWKPNPNLVTELAAFLRAPTRKTSRCGSRSPSERAELGIARDRE